MIVSFCSLCRAIPVDPSLKKQVYRHKKTALN
jgi:hypothetical protein